MANLSVISGSATSSKKAEPLSVAKLRAILEDEGMRRRQSKETFEAFEERLHGQLQDVERELLAEDLGRADVDAEGVMVAGTGYRRVLRAEETYMTAAGPVRVERTLYKDRTDEAEHALVPMELKAGIVGGVLDADGGATGGLGGVADEPANGRGAVRADGQYGAFEEQLGPVAKAARGAVER